MGLFFLLFLFSSGYANEFAKPGCHAGGGDAPSWGPHNIVPNLVNEVFKPFLDAFTFNAVCDSGDMPPRCDDAALFEGTFEERCAKVGMDTVLSYWSLVIQYVSGGWTISQSETLAVTRQCGTILRRGDVAFDIHNECRWATQAYQCVWNNVHWIVLPLLCFVLFVAIPLTIMTCTSVFMFIVSEE